MHKTQERSLFVMEETNQFLHNDSFTIQYHSKSRKRKRRHKKQIENVHSKPLPSMSEEAKYVLKQLLEEMKTSKTSLDIPSMNENGDSVQCSREGHIPKFENGNDTNENLRKESHRNGCYNLITSPLSITRSQHNADESCCEMSDLVQFWETEKDRVKMHHTNIPKLPFIGEKDQKSSRKLQVATVDNDVSPHNGFIGHLPSMEKTFVITPIGFDSRYDTPLDYRNVELPPVEVTKQAHEKCSQWLNNYT